MESYTPYTSKQAGFAERFKTTNGKLLEETLFKKGITSWIDDISVTSNYINRKHSSTQVNTNPSIIKKENGDYFLPKPIRSKEGKTNAQFRRFGKENIQLKDFL